MNDFHFLNQLDFKNYKKELQTSYKKHANLGLVTLRNVSIFPIVRKNNIRYGGVVNEHGDEVEIAKIKRFSPPNIKMVFENSLTLDLANFNSCNNWIDNPIIFLGEFHAHFGHFLLESFSRSWIFLSNEYLKYDVYYISETPINMDYMVLLNYLGVSSDRIIRIDKPSYASRIIIPEASVVLHVSYHFMYGQIIQRLIDRINTVKLTSFRRVYLTRSNNKNNRIFGNWLLNLLFKKNGFDLVFPDKISFERLVEIMKNSQLVVSLSGTSSHNSVFLPLGSSFICLNRSSHYHPPQSFIDELRDLKTVYVSSYLIDADDMSGGPFCVGFTKEIYYFIRNNYGLSSLTKCWFYFLNYLVIIEFYFFLFYKKIRLNLSNFYGKFRFLLQIL